MSDITVDSEDNTKNTDHHKLIVALIIIGIILAVLFLILLPFIFEALFVKCKVTGHNFFVLTKLVDTSLTYYGGLLAFFGTTILGYLTYRQTKIAQQKTEESNEKSREINEYLVQLEEKRIDILNQSLRNAEAKRAVDEFRMSQSYTEEAGDFNSLDIDNTKQDVEEAKLQAQKFDIKIYGYTSNYSDMSLLITNYNSFTVCNLTPVKFVVGDKDDKIDKVKFNSIKMTIEKDFLPEQEKTILKTNFPELMVYDKNGKKNPYEHLLLQFFFSYDDSNGNMRYCKASATIPQTDKFFSGKWLVESVG